jgi:hypothetical protein
VSQLIITNGSSTVKAIASAGIEIKCISWDDVLHDGPVPGAASLRELSDVRATYIAGCGWGEEADIRMRFKERDRAFTEAVLPGPNQCDELILWFEHDLYDQLQLVQLLYELGRLPADAPQCPIPCSMICHDHFVAMTPADQLQADYETRVSVTHEQLDLASRAWVAFTSTNPGALDRLRGEENLGALPFLGPAINRLLDDRPSEEDGLSRTERTILDCLADGPMDGVELFVEQQKTEDAAYMGDGSFELILQQMARPQRPLVLITENSARAKNGSSTGHALRGISYECSSFGTDVLSGRKTAINQLPERWMGGYLIGKEEC